MTFKQGLVFYDVGLRDGLVRVSRALTPGTPRNTFRVVSTSDKRPTRRVLDLGVVDLIVDANGIHFRADRQRRVRTSGFKVRGFRSRSV